MLDNDDGRLTGWRALKSGEYWLLLVGAIVACVGLGVWIVVPLLMAGLSISTLPKYLALWPRAQRVGTQGEWVVTVLLSMLNNLAVSCAAFVLGVVARWLWWW